MVSAGVGIQDVGTDLLAAPEFTARLSARTLKVLLMAYGCESLELKNSDQLAARGNLDPPRTD